MLSKKIVKYIQSLSHKKLRDEQEAFVAEGPKVVSELLGSQLFICKIICADNEWVLENKTLLEVDAKSVYEIDEESLKKISFLKTPNKVVAVFNKKKQDLHPQLSGRLTLMLDNISDPGNLGTIIRIADWFGIENIICSEDCVDCYNPKVVQSTMGSLGRVNILYTSLEAFILSHKDVSVYAATLSGRSVTELKNLQEGIILMGNESNGISSELLSITKNQVTIPCFGNAESLNVAVATGIILSHIKIG